MSPDHEASDARERVVDARTAAYMVAIDRVAYAQRLRGIYA